MQELYEKGQRQRIERETTARNEARAAAIEAAAAKRVATMAKRAGIGLNEYMGLSISSNTEYVNLGAGFRSPGLEGWNLSVTAVDAFDQEDRQALQVAVSYAIPNAF